MYVSLLDRYRILVFIFSTHSDSELFYIFLVAFIAHIVCTFLKYRIAFLYMDTCQCLQALVFYMVSLYSTLFIK